MRPNQNDRFFTIVAITITLSFSIDVCADEIGDRLTQQLKPLVVRYCYECHAGEVTEAELDFEKYKTFESIRSDTAVWLKVRDMLDSGQMPPKDSEQPSDEDRRAMQDWVREFLIREARATAGDPGPVVLRRLNNEEYNFTVQDLTGIETLDPTREFPVDGAAGEGFINTGSAQSMSPTLVTKYLEAAKNVASHAVLLPDGIAFSRGQSRRDWTDERLAAIRRFYQRFTVDSEVLVDVAGTGKVNNDGGAIPLADYFHATIAHRNELASNQVTTDEVAMTRSLNAKYLGLLWRALYASRDESLSPLMDELRNKWRVAKVSDAFDLEAWVKQSQQSLWKFNVIGQLGEGAKQKIWMEPQSPIVSAQSLSLQLPKTSTNDEIQIRLVASDLNDGNDQDFVVWQQPRFVFDADSSGYKHPPILLRDVSALSSAIPKLMRTELAKTKKYLQALTRSHQSNQDLASIANDFELNPQLLKRWSKFVGLHPNADREITGHMTKPIRSAGGYDTINGWGTVQTPSMLTNRSDEDLSFLTLTVPSRGVVMHPSPTMEVIAAWRSPIDGMVAVTGEVNDADRMCGNGAAWRVELRSESGTASLAQGDYPLGGKSQYATEQPIRVRKGDVVSTIVNAKDNSHACDTTHVVMTINEIGEQSRTWDLAKDVVDKIGESNPLPDSYGNKETWHFCASENNPAHAESALIPGSALAAWRDAVVDGKPSKEIARLAEIVQQIITSKNSTEQTDANKQTVDRLRQWRGPLQWTQLVNLGEHERAEPQSILNPLIAFGKHPSTTEPSTTEPSTTEPSTTEPSTEEPSTEEPSTEEPSTEEPSTEEPSSEEPSSEEVGADDLCIQAPKTITVRLPSQLVTGSTFITTARLHDETAKQGSVRVDVFGDDSTQSANPSQQILVSESGTSRSRLETAVDNFRNLFPPALCYTRIVPVDEVVTLTLYFREDHHLKRLMLNDQQSAELDRLWDEMLFVAQEPIALAVALEQIYEFATQDRPDLVNAFEPMKEPINKRADAFRNRLTATEPVHVDAVIRFADRAWRRGLKSDEENSLRDFYAQLRRTELSHDQSIRLTLARVLTSPEFLYRKEQPANGANSSPVNSTELASRLSYFLWSSMADGELRSAADSDDLLSREELLKQTRRMLRDGRVRRLATQFACQWLHLRDFDKNDDKNESLYPTFADLRDDMYEETVLFFENMFRHDGSILDVLDADHTFLNESLARHYGIDGIEGVGFQRVEGMRDHGRGGVLGMASLLASQSGASRTSPILRGNWLYETLLGERLPRPPADVPQLPELIPDGLTARQLIEKHSSDPACAKCHSKIDPYGFALEKFDAIGRARRSSADTQTTLADGKKIEGIKGLKDYLRTERRDDFVRQFCRKLLGFSLGREVQFSDELLLDKMQSDLADSDFRFSAAVETIVTSKPFQNIRGRQFSSGVDSTGESQ